MATVLNYVLQLFTGLVARLYNWGTAAFIIGVILVSMWFNELFDWVLAQSTILVQSALAWLEGSLPESFTDAFSTLAPSGVVGDAVVSLVWVLPIQEVMLVVAGTYATCGVVRLVRWIVYLIVELIPTGG